MFIGFEHLAYKIHNVFQGIYKLKSVKGAI